MNLTSDDFYEYIESVIGVAVDDDTLFFSGVGMDGVDAWMFIETIEEKCHVDFSGYNWEEYHMSETDARDFPNGKGALLLQFSALHLYNVVLAGKWFEPVG